MAENQNRRDGSTLAECFGILETLTSIISLLLAFSGFLVPSWRNHEPLSMFYLVFGLFKQSAAGHDAYIRHQEQIAFAATGISYYILLASSWLLRWCRCWKVGLLVKMFAGVGIVCAVFFYCCMHDYTIGDITATMALAFLSGLFACIAVICGWAARYDTGTDTGTMADYGEHWNQSWEIATVCLLALALISTIITSFIPGWNTNTTTVWKVESQRRTTKVFSGMVLATFCACILTIAFALINQCCQKCGDWQDGQQDDAGTCEKVTIRIFKFAALMTGGTYIFAISAFTSDLYKGIDRNTLSPEKALVAGWVTAALYGAAMLVQAALIWKKMSPQEETLDLFRYVLYLAEAFVLIAVFFVPIRRNLEPVSMFYNVFGTRPCNSSTGQYIQPGAKSMTMGVGIFYLVARLLLIFVSTMLQDHREIAMYKSLSNVLSLMKIAIGSVLFCCTIGYWAAYNLSIADMTLVLVCILFAACCVITGAIVEIKQRKEDAQGTVNTQSENKEERELVNNQSNNEGAQGVVNNQSNNEGVGGVANNQPINEEAQEIASNQSNNEGAGGVADNHQQTAEIGDEIFKFFTQCEISEKDLTTFVILLLHVIFAFAAFFTSGWKIGAPVKASDLYTTCHSMQAYSGVVCCGWIPCLVVGLLCGTFAIVRKCDFCTTHLKELIFALKFFLFLSGGLFSLATAALWLDIETGVDQGTWVKGAPFWLAVTSTLIFCLGSLLLSLLLLSPSILTLYENLWKKVCDCCRRCRSGTPTVEANGGNPQDKV